MSLTEEASTEEARSRCLKIDVSVILDSGYTSQISLSDQNYSNDANFWYHKLGFESSFNFLNKKSQKIMKMEKIINFLLSSKNSAFLSFCFSQNLDKKPKSLIQLNILSRVTWYF